MILSSLTQTRTSDDVADQLRALIQSGELAKGDQLPPQRELATTLGIGRQALREALSMLEALGYVETLRGAKGGTFVRDPVVASGQWLQQLRENIDELDQILDFRIAVESEVAALAATRRDDDDLAAMKAAIDALPAESDRSRFRSADAQFHMSLARAARNGRLERAVRQARADLFLPTDRILFVTEIESTRDEHTAVLLSITAGDAEHARSEIRTHVEHTRRQVHGLIEALS